MRTIELDASGWETPLDFVRALRAAIGATEQHGWSPAAFVDSMVWGGMNNRLEPPYVIRITGTTRTTTEVITSIAVVASVIRDGREEYRSRKGTDVEVSLLMPEMLN